MKNKYIKSYDEVEKLFGYETINGTPVEEIANVDEFAKATISTYTPMEHLKELIDKETPMKPIFNSQIEFKSCRKCKCYLRSSNNWIPNYCSECGQKIDWSHNDE